MFRRVQKIYFNNNCNTSKLKNFKNRIVNLKIDATTDEEEIQFYSMPKTYSNVSKLFTNANNFKENTNPLKINEKNQKIELVETPKLTINNNLKKKIRDSIVLKEIYVSPSSLSYTTVMKMQPKLKKDKASIIDCTIERKF